MAVIECDGLSRWYGDVIAVNNVTASLDAGVTGLLGPNGAGKSTFMRMAMGLTAPSSGQIKVLDEGPWNNKELLKRVGYVGEGDAPWRDRTGRACAKLAASLSGLSAEQTGDAVDRELERVGLADVADRRVDGYSRGMRQRLKFALALLHEPELLILDEPLLGTDPPTRRDLIDFIHKLADEGKSVLVSTHVLPDVEAMTQQIMLLNHGRLMAYGDVHEIRELLEKYPRTVRIATTDPRGIGARLWGWTSVRSLQAEPDAIVVTTHKPADFYDQLQRLLISEDVPFTSVKSLDDNIEAVFKYLVS